MPYPPGMTQRDLAYVHGEHLNNDAQEEWFAELIGYLDNEIINDPDAGYWLNSTADKLYENGYWSDRAAEKMEIEYWELKKMGDL